MSLEKEGKKKEKKRRRLWRRKVKSAWHSLQLFQYGHCLAGGYGLQEQLAMTVKVAKVSRKRKEIRSELSIEDTYPTFISVI